MVSFTFYGGAREIGGNKILLEENDAKVYLDFGMPFNFGEDYFLEEQHLKPRDGTDVLVLIHTLNPEIFKDFHGDVKIVE